MGGLNEQQTKHPTQGTCLFRNDCSRFSDVSLGVFNKTIILLALVGYEMVDSGQLGATRLVNVFLPSHIHRLHVV